MIALVVLATLLLLVTTASALLVIYDIRESRTQLYTVPESGTGAILERDSRTAVTLRLTVCLDSSEQQVSLLAQEWSGPASVPGEVRVFTADPGCRQYRFVGLPLPAVGEITEEGVPCEPWIVSGSIIAATSDRPAAPFSTAAVCIENIPTPVEAQVARRTA
jgi:hypothetical protein